MTSRTLNRNANEEKKAGTIGESALTWPQRSVWYKRHEEKKGVLRRESKG